MTIRTPPTLEYGTPPPRQRRGWDFVAGLVRWSVVVGLIAGVLGLVVPWFTRVFASYQVQLPIATAVLLSASRWFVSGFGWVGAVPLPFLLAYLMSLPGVTPDQRRVFRRYERLLAFLIVAAFMTFTVLALFMPLMALIEVLSGKNK